MRRGVNCHAKVNQGHGTDDKGELAEEYARADSTILFRYHTASLSSAHRVTLCDLSFSNPTPAFSFSSSSSSLNPPSDSGVNLREF